MDFLIKMFRWNTPATWDNYSGHPLLYRSIGESKETLMSQTKLKFEKSDKGIYMFFVNTTKNGYIPEFYADVHSKMNITTFVDNIGTNSEKYRIEWAPERLQMRQQNMRLGCQFLNKNEAEKFSLVLTDLIKKLNTEEQNGDQIKETPQHMAVQICSPNIKKTEQINKLIAQLLENDQIKMVNNCSLFKIKIGGRGVLIHEHAVILIRERRHYFNLQVLDINGKKYLQQPITQKFKYQILLNTQMLKWKHQSAEKTTFYKALFKSLDVLMTFEIEIQQCLKVAKQKKEQINQIKRSEKEKNNIQNSNVQIFKTKEKVFLNMVKSTAKRLYNKKRNPGNQEIIMGKLIFQAKIAGMVFVCNGNKLQFFKIDSNQVKTFGTTDIVGMNGNKQTPKKMIMHSSDNKIIILTTDGTLINFDLNKLITTHELKYQNKIVDICTKSKMAEFGESKNFYGITERQIIEFAPDFDTGYNVIKHYTVNPHFTSISVRNDSSFAIGNKTGEIRLYYGELPTFAASLYRGLGDPISYMQSTKNGKWLLATCKSYILLLSTFLNDSFDLYNVNDLKIDRPQPKKLPLLPEHQTIIEKEGLHLLNAKFDQNRSDDQQFIISGFGEYIIVWSLNELIAGNTDYSFWKAQEQIENISFAFGDNTKIVTATQTDIYIEKNLYE